MNKFKIIFSLAFVFLMLNSSFGQVDSFEFQGPKVYPNGSQIAYFYINGINNIEEANYIQDNIINDDKITRFNIFEKSEKGYRCMAESSVIVSEEFIKNLINKHITEYKKK